ncbi:MAG: asparagine synthase (glutamine-hydrolyzing) [Spirochaetales bacterium]|nr:asparagine synthase (glutamine-hydrolyzing) [Spirochaetales bacterium]
MCGISGFCDFTLKSNKDILIKMTNALEHRGPDDMGCSLLKNDYAQIGLGNRRLAILDVTEKGHQPMFFKNLVIVHNGEIYNFHEIKKQLENSGYACESHSDTEVILQSFHKWHTHCVDRFIGMFAFVLLDKKEDKLYLFRDRAGVKPLYYYWHNDLFVFASELKSMHMHPRFKKKINTDALALYLGYGYIPAPYSIFENTFKLLPGHYAILDLKNRNLRAYKYWDVLDYYNKPVLDISEQEAAGQMENIFKSAFRHRMVSDVPVGVFLSGGYDSSTVAAILQKNQTEKLKTFTIGFHEQAYNEAPYAKKIAEYLGTDHHEHYCTKQDAFEIIKTLPYIYDEPFGDKSAIPTVLVSAMARNKVKVALSADAGDESFAGYNKYKYVLDTYVLFKKLPGSMKKGLSNMLEITDPAVLPVLNRLYNFSVRYGKIKNMLSAVTISESMKFISQIFLKKDLNDMLCFEYKELSTYFDEDNFNHERDYINNMLAIDYKTYMTDDVLVKVDRAAMSVSLEGRDPLLDHRIIEFAAQLPASYKYRGNTRKWLLKEIAHKYIPKKLLARPKMGFGVPIELWFKEELNEYIYEYLSKQRIDSEGLFDSAYITKLRDSYLAGKKVSIMKIWVLLMFEMWYETWMN